MRNLKTKVLLLLAIMALVISSITVTVFAEETTENQAESQTANVAKIGDVEYATLDAAFADVQNGETVTLIADVTVSETLVVPAGVTVTLDLNGFEITTTLTQAFEAAAGAPVILYVDPDTVVLPAGYVVAESNDGGSFAAIKYAAEFLGGSIKYKKASASSVNMRFGYTFDDSYDLDDGTWGWYLTVNGKESKVSGINKTDDNRTNVYVSGLDVSQFEDQIYVRLYYVVEVDGIEYTVFEPTVNSRSVVDVATGIILDSKEAQSARNYAMELIDANNAYASEKALIKKDDEEESYAAA